MEIEKRVFYRDLLRKGRASTLADAEGFLDIVQTLELMGRELTETGVSLGSFGKPLENYAGASVLAEAIPLCWPQFHVTFSTIFDQLRIGRNDAVHQGAYARHISNHAIDVAIVLEDALMSKERGIAHFMVRDVIEAKAWQPVSYIRQQMLKNAFSYLPVHRNSNWHLVSDASLVQYLRAKKSGRDSLMRETLEEAVSKGHLQLIVAKKVTADANIDDLLKDLSGEPVLVVDSIIDDRLLGVITPADIL